MLPCCHVSRLEESQGQMSAESETDELHHALSALGLDTLLSWNGKKGGSRPSAVASEGQRAIVAAVTRWIDSWRRTGAAPIGRSIQRNSTGQLIDLPAAYTEFHAQVLAQCREDIDYPGICLRKKLVNSSPSNQPTYSSHANHFTYSSHSNYLTLPTKVIIFQMKLFAVCGAIFNAAGKRECTEHSAAHGDSSMVFLLQVTIL